MGGFRGLGTFFIFVLSNVDVRVNRGVLKILLFYLNLMWGVVRGLGVLFSFNVIASNPIRRDVWKGSLWGIFHT